MSLVPVAPVSNSLQIMLYPILLADRHLQELYQALDQIIEVEDYLEHANNPIALATLRLTIRYLWRAIRDLSVHRLLLIAEFHRELRAHVHHFQQVPPMDLEL